MVRFLPFSLLLLCCSVVRVPPPLCCTFSRDLGSSSSRFPLPLSFYFSFGLPALLARLVLLAHDFFALPSLLFHPLPSGVRSSSFLQFLPGAPCSGALYTPRPAWCPRFSCSSSFALLLLVLLFFFPFLPPASCLLSGLSLPPPPLSVEFVFPLTCRASFSSSGLHSFCVCPFAARFSFHTYPLNASLFEAMYPGAVPFPFCGVSGGLHSLPFFFFHSGVCGPYLIGVPPSLPDRGILLCSISTALFAFTVFCIGFSRWRFFSLLLRPSRCFFVLPRPSQLFLAAPHHSFFPPFGIPGTLSCLVYAGLLACFASLFPFAAVPLLCPWGWACSPFFLSLLWFAFALLQPASRRLPVASLFSASSPCNRSPRPLPSFPSCFCISRSYVAFSVSCLRSRAAFSLILRRCGRPLAFVFPPLLRGRTPVDLQLLLNTIFAPSPSRVLCFLASFSLRFFPLNPAHWLAPPFSALVRLSFPSPTRIVPRPSPPYLV